ncbi:hypothetical protein MHI22_04925 [Lysinibacillus sp. FSL L8-0312]|uniref:hypothetical protein n=1 Tax=Lysinibacillus sp. FSL L8-0312 TaxID=2921521 RepID=UPI000AB1DFC0
MQQTLSTVATLKGQLDEVNFYIGLFNVKILLKSFIQTNPQSQYMTLHQSIATCLNEIF